MIIQKIEKGDEIYIRACTTPEQYFADLHEFVNVLLAFYKEQHIVVNDDGTKLREALIDNLNLRTSPIGCGTTYIRVPDVMVCVIDHCTPQRFMEFATEVMIDNDRRRDCPIWLEIANAAAGENVIIQTIGASRISRNWNELMAARDRCIAEMSDDDIPE